MHQILDVADASVNKLLLDACGQLLQ